jgi:signal transduction histidine kinase
MRIKDFISVGYRTVHPYEGICSVKETLLEKGFLVVVDNYEYIGILTPSDLIIHPHKIVIDCLTDKEHIHINETFVSAIDKFNRSKSSVLPVFWEKKFIGVIEKQELIIKLKLKIDELYKKSLISQKVKSAFMDNLSHEIRTPLNGLLGFLDIITEINTEDSNVNLDVNGESIRSCANRFLLIMNDIIDLSLLNSGDKIKIFKEDIRIEDLFSDLKEFFASSSVKLNKKTSVRYNNPDISLNIFSDRKKIKHILYHLIDNAIKFSDDSMVEFGYKIENHNIVFFVTNNGSQIDEKIRDKIFEAFYKQDTINNRISDGIGIGLTLVKKMTEILGGKVNFTTNQTETTFYVTLPLVLEMETCVQ